MMTGMLAAVSGLKAHEEMLNIVGNNIANANTIGYKDERANLESGFAETLQAASAPSTDIGGTDPTQIGLGVQLGGTENLMTEGSTQTTGNPLDCAIQGDGFFRVATYDGTNFGTPMYTRAGDFTTDVKGNLVTSGGYYVMGYTLDANGNPTTTPTTIKIPATAASVSISSDGIVTSTDATGTQTPIAAITLAKFPNEAGLARVQGNLWAYTPNAATSTAAITVGTPNDANGLGPVQSGALEMSNVDLASEFTDLITAQNGFQANSRVITTGDDMLQTLVNMKQG